MYSPWLQNYAHNIASYAINNPIQIIALFFFKICHNVGSRLPTSSSQGDVLHPNPKKANRYVLNVKHELNYMQGETYTSLDKQLELGYTLILHVAQPIFSKKTRWQTKRLTIQHMVQQRFSRGLVTITYGVNSSHLVGTSRIASQKCRTTFQHQRRSHLECKQKGLYLLQKNDCFGQV